MKTRELNIGNNVVPIIDELIMELSYIRNGHSPSIIKLQNGVDIIEYLISLSDKFKEESAEDKQGFSPFHDKKYSSSVKYTLEVHINELEGAKEEINNIIKSEESIDQKSIENIQELLLKISLPIWKEQVSILKPNKFKLIEL